MPIMNCGSQGQVIQTGFIVVDNTTYFTLRNTEGTSIIDNGNYFTLVY